MRARLHFPQCCVRTFRNGNLFDNGQQQQQHQHTCSRTEWTNTHIRQRVKQEQQKKYIKNKTKPKPEECSPNLCAYMRVHHRAYSASVQIKYKCVHIGLTLHWCTLCSSHCSPSAPPASLPHAMQMQSLDGGV